MNKRKIWIAVLAGLMIGQLFAENERPLKVINTVRFGYTDNLYRNANSEGSTFITDIVDLSFHAAMSDRTDLMVKSQFNLLTDSGSSEIYPNLYAMLNHNISPRLLLRLSEYYRSSEKSGSGTAAAANSGVRYNYFQNKAEASLDYILTGKDRLGASVSHEMFRHDEEINELDYTTVAGGVSWKRELSPQRTYLMLNLNQSEINYDNRPKNSQTVNVTTNGTYTNSLTYLDDQAFYDATDWSVGLNHTFNQEWQGSIEAGVSYVQPSFSDSISVLGSPTNPPVITTNRVDNSAQLNPILRAGLVYSPSPRTRLTGDISMTHKASDDSGYGGQNTAEVRFGVQHDITAKLMAKATARFSNTAYDAKDDTKDASTEKTEDRMDLELRFTYKLNRINFLELGLRHSENDISDSDDSWKQNTIDVGWRVELN